MSNTPIRLVSLKKDGQDQTVYYDAKAQSYYLRRMPKKSGNDLALFITFLISAIIGTILWIGKFFFPLPTITLVDWVVRHDHFAFLLLVGSLPTGEEGSDSTE